MVKACDESLAEAFTDIALAFESEHEDAVPHTNFDSSNLLADQIVDGTPADVFASADAADMDRLTEADLTGSEPVVFATNVMTIIVPTGASIMSSPSWSAASSDATPNQHGAKHTCG